jgi:hypothetical protein
MIRDNKKQKYIAILREETISMMMSHKQTMMQVWYEEERMVNDVDDDDDDDCTRFRLITNKKIGGIYLVRKNSFLW